MYITNHHENFLFISRTVSSLWRHFIPTRLFTLVKQTRHEWILSTWPDSRLPNGATGIHSRSIRVTVNKLLSLSWVRDTTYFVSTDSWRFNESRKSMYGIVYSYIFLLHKTFGSMTSTTPGKNCVSNGRRCFWNVPYSSSVVVQSLFRASLKKTTSLSLRAKVFDQCVLWGAKTRFLATGLIKKQQLE